MQMGAAKAAPGISFGVIRPKIRGRQVIQGKVFGRDLPNSAFAIRGSAPHALRALTPEYFRQYEALLRRDIENRQNLIGSTRRGYFARDYPGFKSGQCLLHIPLLQSRQ